MITRETPAGAWSLTEHPGIGLSCPVRADDIRAMIEWCDVEHSPRWLPDDRGTYCNVYASDLLHMLGQYLPRMWWYDPSEASIPGFDPMVVYGETAHEMSANMLFRWAERYATAFGLRRYASADGLRSALNEHQSIGVMIAHNTRGHGHVTVCLPDAVSGNTPGDGILQTQAGGTNRELFRGKTVQIGGSFDDIFWGRYEPV